MNGAAIEAYYGAIAPFIDAELRYRGDEAFWARVAEARPGARVLELGAGSGRVTAVLARRADHVVAVDLSAEMLARARERLSGCRNVALHRHDLRTLDLRADFDLVVAANDPFCHLTRDGDRGAALDVVGRHLAPSGRFVLEGLWLNAEEAREAASAAGRIRRVETVWRGSGLSVREETRCDGRFLVRRYEYRVEGRAPTAATCTVRSWSQEELQRLLRRAGMAIEASWGGHDGAAWTPSSTELFVQARTARR